MKGLKLHHVAMAVADLEVYERTTAFYREVLGLPLLRSWKSGPRHVTMLDFGNSILEIVCGAEGRENGLFSHIAVALEQPEEVDAALERCVAAGCTLVRPAGDVSAEEEGSGHHFRFRNGFCRGPAGESLEFFCEY